ncbi:MAG TPA: hypothetical protein VNX65_00050 [Patescibacteria group bacterium]|jgi:hypothetical protein|nr:hypothetical protein [Patescibacteria group bacterium]
MSEFDPQSASSRIVTAEISPRHGQHAVGCADKRRPDPDCPILGDQPYSMAYGGEHGINIIANGAARLSGVQETGDQAAHKISPETSHALNVARILRTIHEDCLAISVGEPSFELMANPTPAVLERIFSIDPDLTLEDVIAVSKVMDSFRKAGGVHSPERVIKDLGPLVRIRMDLGKIAAAGILVNTVPGTTLGPPLDEDHSVYGVDYGMFGPGGMIDNALKPAGYDSEALRATAAVHIGALSAILGLPLHVHE